MSFVKSDLLVIAFLSILIGIVVGMVDTVFGKGLLVVTQLRLEYFMPLILFLGPVGMIFTYFLLKYGKSSSQGMSLVFQTGHKEKKYIPKRLTAFVIIGSWLTHLFGGSAGREGAAIQIGSSISLAICRFFKRLDASRFVIIGMSAGFAGLYGTPIAASFFALEVLTIGTLRYDALLPTLLSAFAASMTSDFLGLKKFHFKVTDLPALDLLLFVKLVIAGIAFSLVGAVFAYLLTYTKKLFIKKLPNPVRRVGIVGVVISILMIILFMGRYSGFGTNLTNLCFSQGAVKSYDWLLKAFLTIITLAAGFQGGEVTPLFAIGATFGFVLSSLLGLPNMFLAALGYATVFGSATNTYLAPIMIGSEIFGFESLPYFFIVMTVAFVFNGNQTIYGQQKIASFLNEDFN